MLWAFAGLLLLAVWGLSRLSFRYDFEAFFPSGDPDLAFYEEFRARFASDDNFLLIALPVEDADRDGLDKAGTGSDLAADAQAAADSARSGEGRFWSSAYLERLDAVTRGARGLPHVLSVQSPTSYRYAIKSPFGFVDYPAVHLDRPSRWARDSIRLIGDERVAGRLFDPQFRAGVVVLQTIDRIDLGQSRELMQSLDSLLAAENQLADGTQASHRLLGRANFQSVLVAQQQREFIWSTLVSGLLVTLVFLYLFRKPLAVGVALISVLLAMLLFLGLLGAIGRPLDFMAVLYPVLMIIVGVSDVVHIMSKYHTELRRGRSRESAMAITRREIGLATLLTSLTTAVGFLTLITSVVPPVRAFGWSAALGVLVAYITVVGFTTSLLLLLPPEKVADTGREGPFWGWFLDRFYRFGLRRQALVPIGLVAFGVFAAFGMSRISTDVSIGAGMPRGAKITEDFFWFEQHLAGFRPFEVAAIAVGEGSIHDPQRLRAIAALEDTMRGFGTFGPPQSITALYKSLHRAENGDRTRAYRMPESDASLARYRRLLDRLPEESARSLVSEDERFARISTTVRDLGTDSIQRIVAQLNRYTQANVDSSSIRFRETGTGILFDKNNRYLRRSLIEGLSMAFVLISLLMAWLFRNLRLVLVSLLPNVVPLLAGAAALGYLGIDLDATTAIIFAISFGIAVDDTIHFLSKMRLELGRGTDLETALYRTFTETGKAIALTSVVLLSGFCILLFSATPGTNYVGLLIAVTLFAALFADLLLIPWLMRLLWPSAEGRPPEAGGPKSGTPEPRAYHRFGGKQQKPERLVQN